MQSAVGGSPTGPDSSEGGGWGTKGEPLAAVAVGLVGTGFATPSFGTFAAGSTLAMLVAAGLGAVPGNVVPGSGVGVVGFGPGTAPRMVGPPATATGAAVEPAGMAGDAAGGGKTTLGSVPGTLVGFG